MSHYTSHALVGPMWEHYSQHGVLAEEFSAFRYNEGLREEDLGDLVLVYGREPTKWQTRQRKGTVLGRNVLTTQLGHFQFYKEAEFQTMQARTQAFLRDRKERATDFAFVASNLVVRVGRTVLGTNQFRFTATLKNHGNKVARLALTKDGELLLREGQSGGPNFLAKSGDEFSLMPGQEKQLSGWCEATVDFVVKDGKVVGREISHRSGAGLSGVHSELTNTGKSSTGFGPNVDMAEALRELTVQTVLWARVEMDGAPPLETVLKSPVLRYMTDSP